MPENLVHDGIEMTPVDSSMLSHVGYHAETQRLHVRFHNGKVYTHEAVPAMVHAQMMQAPSVGKFYNVALKGKFPLAGSGR